MNFHTPPSDEEGEFNIKRMRRSEIIEKEAMERLDDRFDDLPDCVLLHIMDFMNAKDAVQTCVLSKRWKDLWKRLGTLTFDSLDFHRLPFFNKFVSSVLSRRDESFTLHKIDLWHEDIGPRLLNRVMTYATSHHVQQLLISVNLHYNEDFELPSRIFHCRSLTSLKLSFGFPRIPGIKIKLPKSVELPTLKILHLKNVTFATTDNGCAEPFSTCHMLNTLVIQHCYLQRDAKVLCISNSKLFSLTIINWGKPYEITLSTPNLKLLTIDGDPLHQPSSTCNVTCLEEVNIRACHYADFPPDCFVLISWFQVLVNVKIMTLSWSTLKILNALLSRASIRTLLPCFVRLKSLKLHSDIPDEEVSRMVEYLLHNSPLTRVDIIKLKVIPHFIL